MSVICRDQPLRRLRRLRRGSATLWMVIWLPCLLTLFCVLVGVANLWLARVELESALEAAALAAVNRWGDGSGGDTSPAREVGVAYASANFVRGQTLSLDTNYGNSQLSSSRRSTPFRLVTNTSPSNPNQNRECDVDGVGSEGNLVFGAISGDPNCPGAVVFDAGRRPSCNPGDGRYAVRAQAEISLQPLGGAPFVGKLVQYRVQAKATAVHDCASGRPKLIRVDQFICP